LRSPEILRSGEETQAKVISVVDERTIGPVTRSRLTVQIEPGDGEPFEVTTRVAFPTPESRAKIKVGGTVKVRYDKDDRTRVVVDIPTD
jgi:multidrug efflux pump subunit AcrA (membrane-fusion protein)